MYKKIHTAKNNKKYIKIKKEYDDTILIFETEINILVEILSSLKQDYQCPFSKVFEIINEKNYILIKYIYLYFKAKKELSGYYSMMDSMYDDIHYGR